VAAKQTRYRFVLFDLGNTLVRYYSMPTFPALRDEGIARAASVLGRRGIAVDRDGMSARVAAEDRESPDGAVRPLEDRLIRIFGGVDASWPDGLTAELCRAFMEPIFAVSGRYDDALPVLATLRRAGLEMGIVSNTAWGSPASLWREEVARHGLSGAVDTVVFCRDCGWRKPAKQIFEHALDLLGAKPGECVFVGDDPRWDVAGPAAVGMDAVLIDRDGGTQGAIATLAELPDRLAA
jgi:putative hydrolase of the HAD superfamily